MSYLDSTHFVSKSAGRPCMVCFKPSTHKLGEEIAHDEPCAKCGETWLHPWNDDKGRRSPLLPKDDNYCKSMYHLTGPDGQRHNLTAYVCCFHFYMIVGSYAGCSLTEQEKDHLGYIKAYNNPNNVWDNCWQIPCVHCHGVMQLIGNNTQDTLAFLECKSCKQASVVPIDLQYYRKD